MRPEELERLADSIADGKEIDWQVAETAAGPDEEAVVRQLRLVEQIARVHQQAEPDAAESDIAEPSLHARWGPLELHGTLASGVYGRIYRAWDPRLEREVALKVLGCPDAVSKRRASQVIEEARLLARVRHANVITIYGAERFEGCPGLWMELIHGWTLAEIITTAGPLSAGETVLTGVTLCRALSAVHRAGVLHRDIKAQNVMRERAGRIVLMDFGAGREWVPGSTADAELAGTPLYLAPEILEGGRASVQSDIYSLGVLLYYCATGEFPVRGESLEGIRQAHREGRRTFLHDARPELPESFVRAIERALSPDPSQRYQSAGEMESALAHSLGFRAVANEAARRRPSSWARAFAGALALVLTFFAARSLQPAEPPDPVIRRLTFRPGRVVTARFAPDAQTILYSAEWNGRQAEVFTTGFGSLESRSLNLHDAHVLDVSSAGELAVLLRPRFRRGYVATGTLARAPLGGGTPREVVSDVQEADWGPDGTLAVTREVNGRSRIEFPVGRSLFETAGWVSGMRVAPDGSQIAFIHHPTPADDSGVIAVVDRNGQMRTLTPEWASAQGLAWSGGGEEIWFTATESGNARALRTVSRDGAGGVVHRMISKLRLHDVAPDGRLLVAEESTRVAIEARGRGEPRARDLSWLDWSLARDLTPDGQLLLLNESGEGGGAHYGVYLRPMDGSPAVRLGEGSGLSISPDRTSVLAIGAGSSSEAALLILPAGPGEPRIVHRSSIRYQQWGAWFPDGHRVIFVGSEADRGSQVYVLDLRGGSPRPITPEGVELTAARALSPDGRFVAAVKDGKPMLFAVDRSAAQPVTGAATGEVPVHWSRDGSALYVWRRGEVPARIHRVTLATGDRVPWKELMPADPAGVHEILRIVISEDLEAHAYSYTRELSALYLMEHVKRR